MRPPADRHLILVGLPGAGKSTVGRAVAHRLGRSFIDLDTEIERRAGAAVSEIFRQFGEAHFRQLEVAMSEELALAARAVLAPGGGWLTNVAASAHLRPCGRIIYLRARPETALRRLRGNVKTRPLLAGVDPLVAMQRLLDDRASAYETADAVVDTDNIDLQRVVREVVKVAAG